MSRNLVHLNQPVDEVVIKDALEKLMSTDGFMLRCVHAPVGPTWIVSVGPDSGFGANLQDTLASFAVARMNRQVNTPAVVDPRPIFTPARMEILRVLGFYDQVEERVDDLAEELEALVDSIRCGDVNLNDMASVSAEILRVTKAWTDASVELAELEARLDELDPDYVVRNSL